MTCRSIRRSPLAAAAIAAGLVVACGGGDDSSPSAEPDDAASPDDSATDADSATDDDSAGDAGDGSGGGEPGEAVLSTEPVAWSAVASPGGVVGAADAEVVAPTDCPLLTADRAAEVDALAAADTLSLSVVDELGCRFSGSFASFDIRVEAAADVPVDDHSGRAYNIDVEPVVEPQDGPGEKAVLLVDTAFEDLGGGGLPYAYFFVLGDRAVTLRATAFEIDPATWRSLADDVATALDSGAADSLVTTPPPADDTAPPVPGDACEYYSAASIAALLEVDPATVSADVLNGTTCEWFDATTGRYLAVTTSSFDTQGPELYRTLYEDALDVSDEVGVTTYVLPGGGDSVAYVGGSDDGDDGVWTLVRAYSNAGEGAVAAVLANLVPRLTDVPS